MKTTINIPLELEENICPHCNMSFALIGIFHNDDPEYGEYISWAYQVHNQGYSFCCPYCGKDFEKQGIEVQEV